MSEPPITPSEPPTTPSEPRRFALADLDRSRTGLFAGWRGTIAPVFDVAAGPEEIGLFDGDFAAYATSQFVLSESKSSRLRLVRSPETIARSRIDQFALRLLLSGSLAGAAGAGSIEAEAGDVLFIDLLQTLDLQTSVHGGLTADVTLWIPRARLFASISDENALHGLTLKRASPAGALIGASLRALAEHAGRMSVKEMDALSNGVIELAAKAAGPALQEAAQSGVAVPLASFVMVRRFIDRNLASPELGADMVARSFGLSRASLYRLFEPIGGVAGYIRRARLNRAWQEITAADLSDRRIGLIAYQAGFKNVSAFNRAFRAAYGLSPRAARAASLQGLPAPVLKAAAGKDASFSLWLAQLGKM